MAAATAHTLRSFYVHTHHFLLWLLSLTLAPGFCPSPGRLQNHLCPPLIGCCFVTTATESPDFFNEPLTSSCHVERATRPVGAEAPRPPLTRARGPAHRNTPTHSPTCNYTSGWGPDLTSRVMKAFPVSADRNTPASLARGGPAEEIPTVK